MSRTSKIIVPVYFENGERIGTAYIEAGFVSMTLLGDDILSKKVKEKMVVGVSILEIPTDEQGEENE